MSKIKDLQNAMIEAMKAKDKFRKDSISALVSAVKKVGIDAGCREDIPDDMADQEQPDFLDPNATGLKGSIEEKFSSCTYTQGKGGHMGKIGGSNITAADQHLRDIAEKGRNLTSQAPVKQNAVGAGPN